MSNTTDIPVHRWDDNQQSEGSFNLECWGNSRQDPETLHPHRHAYNEIICFIRGSVVHDIDFKSFECRGGEIHFVQSNSVHMLVRDDQAEGISLMFTADFADPEILSVLPFGKDYPVYKLSEENFRELRPLLDLITKEYSAKASGYLHILRNYFHAFLWQLTRHAQNWQETLSSPIPDLYRRFEDLLSKKALTLRNVEAFAEQLHVSTKHLIEVTKQHTGRTPLQLIHEQFLSESKRMLYHTDQPIKEIAYSLGFTDSTNFTKWFKSKTGYTPMNYRTQHGK